MVGSVSTIDKAAGRIYLMGMGGLSLIWLITGVMGGFYRCQEPVWQMLELIMESNSAEPERCGKCVGLGNYGDHPK